MFTCYFCSSQSEVLISKNSQLNFSNPTYVCKSCGLAQQYPIPPEDELQRLYATGSYYTEYKEERLGVKYPRGAESPIFKDGLSNKGERVNLFVKQFPNIKECRVLDIGAGYGEFAYLLRSKWSCDAIHCIEPDERARQFIARELGIAVFKDFSEVLSNHQQYDVIIMNQVFEHVSDPMAFLDKVKPLLKAKGMVWVEVPDIIAPHGRAGEPWYAFFKIGHVFHYSDRTLTRIFERCGFELRWMNHIKNIYAVFVQEEENNHNGECKTPADPEEYKKVIRAINKLKIRRFVLSHMPVVYKIIGRTRHKLESLEL